MLYFAAIVAGISIGILTYSGGLSRRTQAIRIAAALVLIVLAVFAWPVLSPESNWPALTFGLSCVIAAAIAARFARTREHQNAAALEVTA